MTAIAAPAHPAHAARTHGPAARPHGGGVRVRAVPGPHRGDLLEAEPAPVVPLVRVNGPRVVVDPDELADRARHLTSPTVPTPTRAESAAGAADAPPSLPDPTHLCCAVVRGAVEIMRGDRPIAQLARWVSPTVLEALATRATLVRGLPRPARVPRPALVRRARVVRLSPTAAEASVVVEDVDRVRAAALRVEAHRGQWRVVALEIG